MKPRYTSNGRMNSLFVGYEETEKFVFSKLPPTFKISKKRKIVAMVSSLCSEWSDRMGIFIEEIGNLDREDDRDSRSNSHRTKRRRAARIPGIRIKESEHHGGIPEDNTKFMPSSESGEDGQARCSGNNSDDFVSPRIAASKQNELRSKILPSRNSGNVTMKQKSEPEMEPAREGAKAGKSPKCSHANLASNVNQWGHTATNGFGMQTHTTANTDGPVENGHKGNTPLGSEKSQYLMSPQYHQPHLSTILCIIKHLYTYQVHPLVFHTWSAPALLPQGSRT